MVQADDPQLPQAARLVVAIKPVVVAPFETSCLVCCVPHPRGLLPIWVQPEDYERIAEAHHGWTPRRPSYVDVLIEAIEASERSITHLRIDSEYEGVFHCTVVLDDGQEIDARPTHVAELHEREGWPVYVSEDVCERCAIALPEEEAATYLGIDLEAIFGRPEDDATTDQGFTDLMRELGLEEGELFADDPDFVERFHQGSLPQDRWGNEDETDGGDETK